MWNASISSEIIHSVSVQDRREMLTVSVFHSSRLRKDDLRHSAVSDNGSFATIVQTSSDSLPETRS
ncbi:hypothetical protein NKY44_31635 [Sinorhizobium meliloti]|uniref:hypothetical protein n=1 Tax=Rhizobium meliloti TaxID=382 RepID=UPI003D653C14